MTTLKKEMKTETVTAKVTKTTQKRLARQAKEKDRPVSYIINQAIEKYLSELTK